MKLEIVKRDDGKVVLKRIEGDFTDFLPEVLKRVNIIGEKCCQGTIEKLIIPDNIEEIEDSAFEDCGIEELIFEGDEINIGEGAFSENGISKLQLPKKAVLHAHAFYDNELETLFIPKDVKLCGEAIFARTSVTEVEIEDGLTELNNDIFEFSNLEKIKLPNTLTEIPYGAFSNVELKSLEIPEGVEIIGDYAFFDCDELTNVKLPTTLRKIGEGAFSQCVELKSINIPMGCEVAEDAFEGCSIQVNRINCNAERIIEKMIEFFTQREQISKEESNQMVEWLKSQQEVKQNTEDQSNETSQEEGNTI